MTKALEYANGLRMIADFIEAHPDLELPANQLDCYGADSREQAAEVLSAMKPCKKVYGDSLFYITRDFGPLTLRYVFCRDRVCTRKVVGTRIIEAHTEPEKVIPAKEIPERVEEIVEWDCMEPLLKQQETVAA